MRPLTCLKKMEEYAQQTDEETSFYLEAEVLLQGAQQIRLAQNLLQQRQAGEEDLLTFELQQNRMYLKTKDAAQLGSISFDNDCLYYIVLPLIARQTASLEIYPKRLAVRPHSRPQTGVLHVNLILTVRGEKDADRPGSSALMIAALLTQYEGALGTYG